MMQWNILQVKHTFPGLCSGLRIVKVYGYTDWEFFADWTFYGLGLWARWFWWAQYILQIYIYTYTCTYIYKYIYICKYIHVWNWNALGLNRTPESCKSWKQDSLCDAFRKWWHRPHFSPFLVEVPLPCWFLFPTPNWFNGTFLEQSPPSLFSKLWKHRVILRANGNALWNVCWTPTTFQSLLGLPVQLHARNGGLLESCGGGENSHFFWFTTLKQYGIWNAGDAFLEANLTFSEIPSTWRNFFSVFF